MPKEAEITLSRVYTVPLTRAWLTPRHRRAKRAINILREFALRHMHAKDVKIDDKLNELIWARGIHNPPRRVNVLMEKDEDEIVTVQLAETAKPEDTEAKPDATVAPITPSQAETPAEPKPQAEPAKK